MKLGLLIVFLILFSVAALSLIVFGFVNLVIVGIFHVFHTVNLIEATGIALLLWAVYLLLRGVFGHPRG